MIWVVAIEGGGSRVRRASAPDARGAHLRAGGSSDDDLSLPGCERVAELVCDGGRWHVKTQGAPLREARDGDSIGLGSWRLFVFVESAMAPTTLVGVRRLAEALAALESEDDLPRLVGADGAVSLRGPEPLVAGTADTCDVRMDGGPGRVSGIIRRDTATGATTFHPVSESARLSDGTPILTPVRLTDGRRVVDAGGELRFVDPQEEIDRLLASLEPPVPAPLSAATTEGPRPRWRRPTFGNGPDADVSIWEAGLFAVGLVSFATFLCVYVARL